MSLPTILSLVFFATFCIYFFMGIFIFSISRHSVKNYLFFTICVSLTVWSFAFSIANSAVDYETALLWRRISALGWGTIFSILLHFILVLTGKTQLLQKKWFYVLLYFPAVICILVFSLHSTIANGQYNLSYTSTGWVNLSVNNGLDWFFNIYFTSFSIASIALILHWRITVEQKMKKVVRLLTTSLTIAVIIGSVTDIVFSIFFPGEVPQMAPVIIMIPIITIFYSIKRYDFLKPSIESQIVIEGEILNASSRTRLYQYISLTYIVGSFMKMMVSYFICQDPLGPVLIFSAILFLGGLFIQLIGQFKIKMDHKDMFVGVLIALSIPMITLNFVEYASITVWAAPAMFLILSILFNNRRILFIISAAVIFTQLWVWSKVPSVTVQVDASDHVSRIFLFAIFIAATSYVNRVFIKRLQENENQVRFQKMMSQISASFVTVNKSNIDETIGYLLQLSGEQYEADRSHFYLLSQDQKTATYAYGWCKEGIDASIKKSLGEIHTDAYPWWTNQILSCGEVYIPDLEMLPPQAEAEKELLSKQQIKSLLYIPVITNGKTWGFLCFDTVKSTKVWRKDYRELLKILSHILADALTKVKAEEEIKYMAYYDVLTGLPNRTLFKDRLQKEIHLAQRTEKMIGVFYIDLDSFKAINETLGHESGDELLKKVAYKLSNRVRKHDTVSRFGGDEFSILLTNISKIEDIFNLADNIIKTFESPIIVKGQEFFITASAGISIYPQDGEEPEELIKNADMAMYVSKHQGKNRFTLCSPILKEDILKKMKLTNSLYRALDRDELELFYQPQVCVETKKIIGIEALIRWHHPDMGIISPLAFISLAEQTGLIIPIGEWVIKTACRQSMAWQALGIPPIRMAVNLSAEQFCNTDLVSTVQNALRETGLSPQYLELEITESIAVKGAASVVQVLNELKNLGLTISIDDFGTEYSSLSRLKMLPIDRIKMDKQFVHSISKSSKDDAIVKIIIQLAQSLDLKVIAEGVETKSQLDFLKNQVCDEVQGYYYYMPKTAAEIEKILLLQ